MANDVQGNWIPPTDEDGIETALQTFNRNVQQRFQELVTRFKDGRTVHPDGEVTQWEARRRLIDGGAA